MDSSGISFYAASVSQLCDEALFRKAYQKMPKERQEKIDRLHLEKDRRLSLGAFLLLMWGMRQRGKKEIWIKYGKEGKPYIEGEENLYFNLSHSKEYAACVLSEQEVGCDVERISECRLRLAKRFFSASEYEMLLRGKTEEEKKILFYRFWTLKESFVKAVGKGLYLPLDSFSVLLPDDGKICVRAEKGSLIGNRYYFQEFSDISGYRCAICGLDERIGDGKTVVLETVHLSDIIREL